MSNGLCRKILIVEDEPTLRLALRDALEAEGCNVQVAEDGNTGLELFRQRYHDIVLTDMVMPGLSGIELLEKIKEARPETHVFAFTAFGNVDTAVKAMKLGAVDFIAKPFRIAELVERIRGIVERDQIISESKEEERQELDERYRFGQIIGRSPQMQEIYDLIETVATSDANILITGESGTGKEIAASAVHYNSPRREQPFIKVSCASLSETLLESELFGHEKGSFTGAHYRKIGRFEQAHKGTLFLDEIGDLSETVQVKLLRVLQEREFERVGGTETIHVDVRIVCATLHDIENLVESGNFREDLYYRINTVQIKLPSLSERKGDIVLLADHFRELHSKRINKHVEGFESRVYAAFENYSWPGNVRELKNAVERAVLLTTDKTITLDELPAGLRAFAKKEEDSREKESDELLPLDQVMQKTEARHIRMILKHTGFNRTRAAQILKISRKTLWEKMRYYNIDQN